MLKIQPNIHPTAKKLFHQREMLIATRLGTELAMRPLLKQYLGLSALLAHGLDADRAVKLSGHRQRPSDPASTLRKKILESLEISGKTVGIGSEGAFGPHPRTPFINAYEEIVMLIDLENDLEISERVISTETNHGKMEIQTIEDLAVFTEKILFPSHAIVLNHVVNGQVLSCQKGIISWEHLHATYHQLNATDGIVQAEVDISAFLNPTRMKIIERATERLLKKVLNSCPSCLLHGFERTEIKPAQASTECDEFTDSYFVKVYQCQHCDHTAERYVPYLPKAGNKTYKKYKL